MLNSRDIALLRPDVAANCRVFLEACKDAGLQVLVTATVRDEAYQQYCYDIGAAKTPYPSFHGKKAGLAFDICKNIKDQEYVDLEFFRRCGEIGERIGFEWGGRWKSFQDRPHFQWSQAGRYSSAMVRAGKLPPIMPLYTNKAKEEETYMAVYKQLKDVPVSYQSTIKKLMSAKALIGQSDPDPKSLEDNIINVSEDYCRIMVTLDRMGKLF